MKNQKIDLIQWFPIGLIFGGLLAKWLDFDKLGIIILAGFILYGLVRCIDGLRKGLYKHLGIGLLKLLMPIIIILLSVDSLVSGGSNFAALATTLACETLILDKIGRENNVIEKT